MIRREDVCLLGAAGWATAILPVNNCRFILILFYLFHEAGTTGRLSALLQSSPLPIEPGSKTVECFVIDTHAAARAKATKRDQ